jgi:hypothetical protein
MSNSNNLPTTTGVNNQELQSQLGNIQAMRKKATSPTQYNARITRNNPGAIVILIDQSGSMTGEMVTDDGKTSTKAILTTEIINSFLSELLNRCITTNGGVNDIKDYFNIVVIGYGQEDDEANIAWEGNLLGKSWISVDELKGNILSITETIEKNRFNKEVKILKKIWLTPKAIGLTPMKSAFLKAKTLIADWVLKNENSFPPLIFNITDGEVTDVEDFSELVDVCTDIKKLKTRDGEPIIFNYHMSNKNENEILFPSSSDNLGDDEYTTCLQKISSVLPEHLLIKVLNIFGIPSNESKNRIGLLLNVANIDNLTKLLNIGTVATIV